MESHWWPSGALVFPTGHMISGTLGLERLLDFLKNDPVYGHCSIMLGVPMAWRTLNADCVHDSYLHTLVRQCDLALPWTVQRYSPLLHNDMERLRDNTIEDHCLVP